MGETEKLPRAGWQPAVPGLGEIDAGRGLGEIDAGRLATAGPRPGTGWWFRDGRLVVGGFGVGASLRFIY